MLAICATVWEGQDYVPLILDEWIAAPAGQLTVAELDGRVAALAHLARLAPGEYWLEGIRVHVDYRQRGLAAALHDYHLDLWRGWAEPGTLRLVTSHASIARLCERTGFRRIFEFAFAEAVAAPVPHAFVPVTAGQAGRALDFLRRVPWYAETRGLCDLGWKWRALTADYLAERIAGGGVYRWRDWDGVAMLMPPGAGEPDEPLWIQFPGVSPEQRVPFLVDVRGLAGALGAPRVRWSTPLRGGILDELPRAGYAPVRDEVESCYEIRR